MRLWQKHQAVCGEEIVIRSGKMEIHVSRGQTYDKAAAAAAKSLQSCPTLCDPKKKRLRAGGKGGDRG